MSMAPLRQAHLLWSEGMIKLYTTRWREIDCLGNEWQRKQRTLVNLT